VGVLWVFFPILFVCLCCCVVQGIIRSSELSVLNTQRRERERERKGERGIGQASKRVLLSPKPRSILSVVVVALMLCT
jgi:hypothetical protein